MSPSSLPFSPLSSNPSPLAPPPASGRSAEPFSSSLQRAQLSASDPAPAPSPKPAASAPAPAAAPKRSEGPKPEQPDAPPASEGAPATPAPAAEETKPQGERSAEEPLREESAGMNPNLAFLLGAQAMTIARSPSEPGSAREARALATGAGVELAEGAGSSALEASADHKGALGLGLDPSAFQQALGTAVASQAEGSAKGQSAAEEQTLALGAGSPSAAALALAASQGAAPATPGSEPMQAAPIPLAQGSQAFADQSASVLTRMSALGAAEAIVRVSPEALGPIRIEISMAADASKAMSVSFSAADAQTTALLQGHLDKLSETLGAMGWQLQEVKATTDASLGQERQPDQQFAGSAFDGSGQRQGAEREQAAGREPSGSDFGRLLDEGWKDSSAEFSQPASGRDPRRLFDFYA